MICHNLLGIVWVVVNFGNIDAYEKVKMWSMLAIGTDFDGMYYNIA
jgi:hypothetical protein